MNFQATIFLKNAASSRIQVAKMQVRYMHREIQVIRIPRTVYSRGIRRKDTPGQR